MKRSIIGNGLILVVFAICTTMSWGQETRIYKVAPDGAKLYLSVHKPANTAKKNPAIVFFHGGGYNGGTPAQFTRHTEYFLSRGLTVFNVQYRLRRIHGSTPMQAVSDGKAAMRYVRSRAKEFGIHPKKIIASGGSAGGHLAASCALLEGFEEGNNGLKVSCVPNALVLFNPVVKIEAKERGGWRGELLKQYPEHSFSPWHNIRKGAPPTIFFLGTEDALIPVGVAEEYKEKMESAGSRCELFLYEGAGHGFFNFRENQESPYFFKTVYEADRFLESLGYLEGEPTVKDFKFGPYVDPVPEATAAFKTATEE